MSRLSAAISLSWVLALPPIAFAQERPKGAIIPAEGLPAVFLLDSRGAEYRGKLLRVDDREVTMLVKDHERTFQRNEIVRIEKRGDSLKNGAIIGAITGAALGLLAAGISDCPTPHQASCTGTRIAILVTSVGIYTGVGTGVDAAIRGRTLIYQAPSGSGSRRILGVAYTVRW